MPFRTSVITARYRRSGGDTEDSRWDDAVKYRITYGPVHFGAMGRICRWHGWLLRFGLVDLGAPARARRKKAHNTAYGFNVGAGYHRFSADVVFQHYNQAISVLNPLLGPQSLSSAGQYQSSDRQHQYQPHHGGECDCNDQHCLWHRDGQQSDHGRGQIFDETTSNTLSAMNSSGRAIPTTRWAWAPRIRGGYLMSGVEDNNLDSGQDCIADLVDGREIRVQPQDGYHSLVL